MSRIESMRAALGGVHPLAATKVKDHLEPYVAAFIRHAPFFVIATSNAAGDCDASPKGGRPGFVQIVDERTLLIPDYGGNRLFQGYENFESNPKAGLVFMIPGLDITARVNGRVEVLELADLEQRGMLDAVRHPDPSAGLVQGFLLHIDQAYFHCPRSFQFAALWDAETIERNVRRSIKDLAATPVTD